MNRRNLLKLIPVTIVSLLGIKNKEIDLPMIYKENGVDIDMKYIKDKRWDVILKGLEYSINKNPNGKRMKIEVI